jgi:hypothetical protein
MKTVALKYSVKDTVYFSSIQNKCHNTNFIFSNHPDQNFVSPGRQILKTDKML